MKGIWGRVTKWSVGTLGAAGLALIAYVVEHGELPAWLSTVLSGLSSFLRAEVPWGFWEILVIFLTPCFILGGLIVMLVHRNSVDIDDFNAQCDVLDATNASMKRLEKEYLELKSNHESLLASTEMLMVSNSGLVEQNEELKKQIATMVFSAEPKEFDIDEASFAVLNAVATLTERDVRVELDSVESLVRLGKIRTHAALDVLSECGLISASGNVRGTRYRLTAQGRSYYLEHKN